MSLAELKDKVDDEIVEKLEEYAQSCCAEIK